MGKYIPQATNKPYKYPSRFGSHSSMIDETATAELANGNLIVCADDYGTYTTERDRLDTGLADPNRYTSDRVPKA